jgi:hypothetical protein
MHTNSGSMAVRVGRPFRAFGGPLDPWPPPPPVPVLPVFPAQPLQAIHDLGLGAAASADAVLGGLPQALELAAAAGALLGTGGSSPPAPASSPCKGHTKSKPKLLRVCSREEAQRALLAIQPRAMPQPTAVARNRRGSASTPAASWRDLVCCLHVQTRIARWRWAVRHLGQRVEPNHGLPCGSEGSEGPSRPPQQAAGNLMGAQRSREVDGLAADPAEVVPEWQRAVQEGWAGLLAAATPQPLADGAETTAAAVALVRMAGYAYSRMQAITSERSLLRM